MRFESLADSAGDLSGDSFTMVDADVPQPPPVAAGFIDTDSFADFATQDKSVPIMPDPSPPPPPRAVPAAPPHARTMIAPAPAVHTPSRRDHEFDDDPPPASTARGLPPMPPPGPPPIIPPPVLPAVTQVGLPSGLAPLGNQRASSHEGMQPLPRAPTQVPPPIMPGSRVPSRSCRTAARPMPRARPRAGRLEVTPRGLGIATVAGFCEELIRRNSRLRAAQKKIFTTARDKQDPYAS